MVRSTALVLMMITPPLELSPKATAPPPLITLSESMSSRDTRSHLTLRWALAVLIRLMPSKNTATEELPRMLTEELLAFTPGIRFKSSCTVRTLNSPMASEFNSTISPLGKLAAKTEQAEARQQSRVTQAPASLMIMRAPIRCWPFARATRPCRKKIRHTRTSPRRRAKEAHGPTPRPV